MDFSVVKQAVADATYQAMEHTQRACAAAELADREPWRLAEHLATARREADLAHRAAHSTDEVVARARDAAHGARAAARKAGAETAAHQKAVDEVERIAEDQRFGFTFAHAASSFARGGMAAHERRVNEETLRRMRAQLSALSNKVNAEGERRDLADDIRTIERGQHEARP